MAHRVLVTGIGVICSIGSNVQDFWLNALEGHTVVRRIPEKWLRYSDYKSKYWAPLPEVKFRDSGLSRVELLQHDRSTLLAVVATEEALKNAQLSTTKVDVRHNRHKIEGVDSARAGIFLGTGVGGVETLLANHAHQMLARQLISLHDIIESAPLDLRGDLSRILENLPHPPRINPYVVPMTMPHAVAPALGIRYGVRGQNVAVNEACASSTVAIGRAFHALRSPQSNLDLAIVGGTEALSDPYGAMFRGFDSAGTLAHGLGDPTSINRPFDTARSGFLFTEGGATILILERRQHARKRGVEALAEIVGFAESFEAYNMMAMDPDSAAIESMIAMACTDARIRPYDVAYVNAHGTGTILNDEIECRVIERVYRPDVLVNSSKSLTGHLLGASGGLEAAVTALSLRDQRTHPTINLTDPIADLNFSLSAKAKEIEIAVSQSFAFGGNNASLVLRVAE